MPRILLVEDNEMLLTGVMKILIQKGHTADVCQNGKEAIELVQKNDYDLVITDLLMPVGTGLELITAIKNNEAKQHMKIIVISSMTNTESITEAMQAGADSYLTKPLNPFDLLKQIDKLVAKA